MATRSILIPVRTDTVRLSMEIEVTDDEAAILERVRRGMSDDEIKKELDISSGEFEMRRANMKISMDMIAATREGFAEWKFRRK